MAKRAKRSGTVSQMESAPEPPQEPSAASVGESAPEHLCPNCSAAAGSGQRWCLECGAELPQPRRAGMRPVIGIATTLTVLVGAASAAGFTLLQDGKKPPPPATTIAQTPPPTQTTPPAGETVPPSTPPPDSSTDLGLPDTGSGTGDTGTGDGSSAGTDTPPDNTAPDLSDDLDTSTPNDPPPDDSAPDVGEDDGNGSVTDDPDAGRSERRRASRPRLHPTNIAPGNVAVVFGTLDDSADPGEPGLAADASKTTAWRTPVAADPSVPPEVGVYLDLAGQERLTKVTVDTATPGMSFELYGARSGPPASVTGAGWTHLGSKQNAGRTTTISLGGQRFRYVLVWVTGLPPGLAQASINEIGVISPQP